jgi:hypothetical protein
MMTAVKQGLVSVVLVNFRGADDTMTAIGELRKLEWPTQRLEIVVVDNNSGDDSVDRIQANAPDAILVELKENVGFAGGCNAGISASTGEYIALLNNDARPDPLWVAAAMAVFSKSRSVGAVASRVLDWEGKKVDYIGAALTWFGMGYKPFTGESAPSKADTRRDVLFGTGSAMFVRRVVFQEIGGFDERYFMFFEDVDLGWRLNLAGYRFVYEPSSLAFHRHHGSMSGVGQHKENYLLERNALFTLFKNLDDENLQRILPASLLLSVRRGMVRGEETASSFDIRNGLRNEARGEFGAEALAPLFAMDEFIDALPSLRQTRTRVQTSRRMSDAAIWRLFGRSDAPVLQQEDFLRGYENLVEAFDAADTPVATKVLVITGDPIGQKMAGPAIRSWNMADAMRQRAEVVLVSLAGVPDAEPEGFQLEHVRPGDERAMAKWENWADVIVFQGLAMAVFEVIRNSKKIIVADLYDPMHLEQLEQARELPEANWSQQFEQARSVMNEQLTRADYFLCASDRQRHFYLGQLMALGRINTKTYANDPDLERLIAIVPFGLQPEKPQHIRPVVKDVIPGIESSHKLLLWSGGLYNWFDPVSLIEAVAIVHKRRGGVHLYFQGTKHPHPGVPEMAIVRESREAAFRLGVLDVCVHFNESWVDFDDRQNYLIEADAGVSTHHAHIETTYSFRTRILDYLWAGLPMVVTEGDHFGDLVRSEGLGIAVEAHDVDGLAEAIEKVLFDTEFARLAREKIESLRQEYTWQTVLSPLMDFIDRPYPAADRDLTPEAAAAMQSRRMSRSVRRSPGFRNNMWLATHYFREGGVKLLAGKIARRLLRR